MQAFLDYQEDLFASASSSTAIDTSFRTAKRIDLDATSWVEVVPAWLSGAHAPLQRMTTSVPWRQLDRKIFDQVFREPRLTAQYERPCDAPEPILAEAAAVLSQHYEIVYDSLWLNFYRDGQDSTGWHRDHFSCRRDECVVPVLTLGAQRRFLIKPRAGGRSVTLKPMSGDLVVMGGRSQKDWVHSVPKESMATGPRMSINFQSSMQAESFGRRG